MVTWNFCGTPLAAAKRRSPSNSFLGLVAADTIQVDERQPDVVGMRERGQGGRLETGHEVVVREHPQL
jgi:hypothetical protein